MKWYKKLSILLAGVMCFGVAACADSKNPPADPIDPDKDNTVAANPIQTVTEPAEHPVTNGLHNVKVTESSRVFAAGGKTEYKIVTDGNVNNLTAARFMAGHVREATGASIEVVANPEGMDWNADSKYIVLDVPEMFTAAGLTMPSEDLGQTGYYIKSVGNSVFVATVSDMGAQYGAIAFLRHTIGYEMYSEDTVVYSKSGETLPDMEIVEKPDFEFYVQGNAVSSTARYGMGFLNTSSIFIPVEGENWHNSLDYLPPDTYNNKDKPETYHPKWYSTSNNELCYSAHGDETEFNLMATEIANKIKNLLVQYPDRSTIALTIEDHNTNCECTGCTALREAYGGADSAGVIKLCNAVNRQVQAYLEEEAQKNGAAKRSFNIIFFAYNKMEQPPVVKENGVYRPIDDTVVCDENVGVYIAPIRAAYNQSFYHENNKAAKEVIEGWGALSSKIYMWLYETNYSHYLYPLNTYDTMIETYRFCKSNDAIFMMNEGQYDQGNVTHFGKLKEYFNARAEFNVNDNYNDIVNDFFANYFRDAAGPMREYFDELQAHLRYLEEAYPADVNGNIYNSMEQAKLWPKNTLDNWMTLINGAYAAIEHYRTENPELYEVLENHIKLESIFPRFALIRLYPGMYSANTLREMRVSFRDDCYVLRVTELNEQQSLDTVFASWGI